MPNDDIRFEVRGKIKDGFRLKLSHLGIGMYVDGFTATKSPRNTSGYWLQPPRQYVSGEWKRAVEFDTKKDFWQLLDNLAINAIREYMGDHIDMVAPVNDDDEDWIKDLGDAFNRIGAAHDQAPD